MSTALHLKYVTHSIERRFARRLRCQFTLILISRPILRGFCIEEFHCEFSGWRNAPNRLLSKLRTFTPFAKSAILHKRRVCKVRLFSHNPINSHNNIQITASTRRRRHFNSTGLRRHQVRPLITRQDEGNLQKNTRKSDYILISLVYKREWEFQNVIFA